MAEKQVGEVIVPKKLVARITWTKARRGGIARKRMRGEGS
jgi:hypothetical protein